jgi:competence ComEA-like helix-hairpin-helix protein
MKRFFNHVQTATGATRSEIFVVLALGGAVLFGHLINLVEAWIAPPRLAEATQQSIVHMLDSLSVVAAPSASDAQGSVPATEERDMRATAPVARRQTGVINLNTASLTRLQDIPGVGEATAKAIDEYRRRSPFRRPEDVMNIRGIGEKKFGKMRPYIAAP